MWTNEELMRINQQRQIVQICYVTDDCQRTIEYLYQTVCFGPWKILVLSDQNTTNVRIHEDPVEEPFAFKVALCRIGQMQIEVIEPLYGPTIYGEYLRERGCGIHHFKEKLPCEAIRTALSESRNAGAPEAFHGEGFQGISETDMFWYIDTYRAVGAYYEFGNCPEVILPKNSYEVWP